MRYLVKRAIHAPSPDDGWTSAAWTAAETLEIAHFHPRSSAHRPRAQARLLYDQRNLYLHFHVRDRFVRCVHTRYQDPVSRDSCVEAFFQPDPQRGYFNFEFNCGGTMLLYYIEGATADGQLGKHEKVPESISREIVVRASLPPTVDPEIPEPVEWTLSAVVPFSVFQPWVDGATRVAGQRWRGNFFKCGDDTSHPHWASWSPIGELLRFHQPDRFGTIEFEARR